MNNLEGLFHTLPHTSNVKEAAWTLKKSSIA